MFTAAWYESITNSRRFLQAIKTDHTVSLVRFRSPANKDILIHAQGLFLGVQIKNKKQNCSIALLDDMLQVKKISVLLFCKQNLKSYNVVRVVFSVSQIAHLR